MSKKDDKVYYLIINDEGKFNYSNKGFQATPHYISEVTAKYRVKDLIEQRARWFDPAHDYLVQRVLELQKMIVRTYELDKNGQMLLVPANDELAASLTLREFAESRKMDKVVKTYDAVMSKLPATMPAPSQTNPQRVQTTQI